MGKEKKGQQRFDEFFPVFTFLQKLKNEKK